MYLNNFVKWFEVLSYGDKFAFLSLLIAVLTVLAAVMGFVIKNIIPKKKDSKSVGVNINSKSPNVKQIGINTNSKINIK